MAFARRPVREAAGTYLAHSLTVGGTRFGKGYRLTEPDLATLIEAGVEQVTSMDLGPDDVHEDEAAGMLAANLLGSGLRATPAATGRVNIYATTSGLLRIERQRIEEVNRIDESVTIATLPDRESVAADRMVATVKIIPFSVHREILARALEPLSEREGATLSVAAFRPLSTHLVQTTLPGLPEKILEKTERVTGDRMAGVGGVLTGTSRCAHDATALAEHLTGVLRSSPDLVLIAGASAIFERNDVLPTAIEAAGGTVDHMGMPVDPGNLILLATIDETPVIGLPGCARSPKLNGFDWVLRRLASGEAVDGNTLMGMGIGGLLTDIPSRPLPRTEAEPGDRADRQRRRLEAIILAAGTSRRMGGENKLLADLHGKPIIRRVAEAVAGSGIERVIVVTGRDHGLIAEALDGVGVDCVFNPDYETAGMAHSLKIGLHHVSPSAEGVMVCLGDMPLVTGTLLSRLIRAFDPAGHAGICVPVHENRRGHPVIFARRHFPAIMAITGDQGARSVINAHLDDVIELPVADASPLIDVDTPEALAEVQTAGEAARWGTSATDEKQS